MAWGTGTGMGMGMGMGTGMSGAVSCAPQPGRSPVGAISGRGAPGRGTLRSWSPRRR